MWENKLQQCVAGGTSYRYYNKMESSSSSSTTFEGNTKMMWNLNQVPEEGHEIQSDQSSQGGFRKLEPEWLERFFKRTFFEPCSEHPIHRNELNKYCIDCNQSLCQYCLSLTPHEGHRLLKIYRHVYKDVVPVDEIDKHIDCSKIQRYKSNKQLVIALTPLPHSGSKTSVDEATCQICKRKLIKYDIYSYCSISCKVEAFTKKDDHDSPPFLSLLQNAKQGAELIFNQAVQKEEIDLNKAAVDELKNQDSKLKVAAAGKANDENPNKRKRKRKGIPCRSPLF